MFPTVWYFFVFFILLEIEVVILPELLEGNKIDTALVTNINISNKLYVSAKALTGRHMLSSGTKSLIAKHSH
jgi:hypothetical protein